jgi:hypothetical protein
MTHSVVDLDRVGDNWIGTRFRLGPSTLVRSR